MSKSSHAAPSFDCSLPISQVVDETCAALRAGNVVLQAEPGAGKSTGLPLAILASGVQGKILMLEPRRLAAQNVASRLAYQLGEPLGQTVGLRMRGRTEVSAATRLEVVTEGVLTRILQNDPLLEGISLIIFDEFHERSLHADLGLALCLDVQQSLREDLRLLLMSATLDGDSLCRHIGAAAPIVCQVRQFEVQQFWHAETRDPLPQVVARVCMQALAAHSGDVLVFLPGIAEIRKTARALQPRLPVEVELHLLYGAAGAAAQRAATSANSGQRRVILSTSIAETSITIDGVSIVIDSGLERRSRFDPHAGVERLETVNSNQASATQRAGRAGRTGPGVCYRLWAETGHSRRAKRWQPEVLRADLTPLLMELGLWGVQRSGEISWVDSPPESAVSHAMELMAQLGAWGPQGLTNYGNALAKLPVHPRLAHMLLWAQARGAGQRACALVAVLEEPAARRDSDLGPELRQLTAVQKRRAQQLRALLPGSAAVAEQPPPSSAVLLAQAYPDRIAKRRAAGGDARYQLSSGSGAVLAEQDSLAHAPWLVIAGLGGAGTELRIFDALALDIAEIQQCSPELITRRERVVWDDRAQRVSAETQWRLGEILIESRPLHAVDPALRAEALLQGIRRKGLLCLPWTEDTLEWRARVARMRELSGDTQWPAVDDASLLDSLEDWLLPWLAQSSSLKALLQLDLLRILQGRLDYSQQQLLDQWFPRRYTVPSGSQIQLRYACEGNPVLSVKLQEMFGCSENPAVAQGRLRLKVELLSPARRPVQITEDLANFWHNSYDAVRKDLAGRYPKHPWPDDPLQAQATARAKPRKR